MPKVKISNRSRLEGFVKEYNVFKTDGQVLYCKFCNVTIVADKKSQLVQHLSSTKHKENARKSDGSSNQTFISDAINPNLTYKNFCINLCKMLVSSDIPLNKLANPHFAEFIHKYTNFKVPDQTTLRKNYIKLLYGETMLNIKSIIRNEYVWLSIDETTDVTGRYVANVVVGILNPDELRSRKRYLLNVTVLDKANGSTIARLFDDSVKLLGDEFNRDHILLFLSDAAPYMVKAASAIKIFYPKILHVTCLAHGIHRIAEKIRSLYPNVDKMIASVKKIFLKAPSRVQIFKEIEPGLALPPKPVITRWGTWIEAVEYYATNFEKIENVLSKLIDDDSAALETIKDLFARSKTTLKNDLIFISSNYGFLSSSIAKLETAGLPLISQIGIVEQALRKIETVKGPTGNQIKSKIADVMQKNNNFKILQLISNILSGNADSTHHHNYTNVEVLAFKYAPITSVDVERTFSMYKNLLRANRQSFTFENLQHHFIIYCNEALNS